jgi:hypothetical protein
VEVRAKHFLDGTGRVTALEQRLGDEPPHSVPSAASSKLPTSLLGKPELVSNVVHSPRSSRPSPPLLVPTQRVRVPSGPSVSSRLKTLSFGKPDVVSNVVHSPRSNWASPPPYVPNQMLPSALETIDRTRFERRRLGMSTLVHTRPLK